MKEYLVHTLAEILLVMIGILLALQVNNWNQDRIRSEEEVRLLVAVSKEMEGNKFRSARGHLRQTDIVEAATRLLGGFSSSGTEMSREQFDRDIQKLFGRWFFTSSTSTYDILVGSGQLGLISSVELRGELSRLKLQMELLGTYENKQADFVDNQLAPYLNRGMDRLPGAAKDYQLDSVLASTGRVTPLKSWQNDLEFRNLLIDLIRHTQSVLPFYERIDGLVNRIDSTATASLE